MPSQVSPDPSHLEVWVTTHLPLESQGQGWSLLGKGFLSGEKKERRKEWDLKDDGALCLAGERWAKAGAQVSAGCGGWLALSPGAAPAPHRSSTQPSLSLSWAIFSMPILFSAQLTFTP